MHSNDRPIGIFDSGIGGLTVAAALHKRLPGENLIYLGDTGRVPYGTKSVETIRRYATQCALFLLNQNVKMIVVACNTVSAVALEQLREILRTPMIGVVEPGVEAALRVSQNNNIGVIGTPSTIHSKAYQTRLKELRPDAQVLAKACPLLVPLAEDGKTDGEIVNLLLSGYLRRFTMIDTLILGCTHYPLFRPAIHKLIGGRVKIVDSAETTAEVVENVILREGLLNTSGSGTIQCYVTDISREINRLSKLFFGKSVGRVRKISIDEY